MGQADNNDAVMKEAWNTVARFYQDRYAIQTKRIHYGPLAPSEDILQLLGKIDDTKYIIELGSGAGQNAIVLAKQGAHTTAIDISGEQLAVGKRIAEEVGVEVAFVEGSFLDFTTMQYDGVADIVLSVYALQYCTDMDEMIAVFKSVAKALKPDGRFVFSLDHPIRAHGYWKDNVFIIDNYFDRDQKEWLYKFPEADLAPRMVGSFKTLSDYYTALMATGFEVKQILEPAPIHIDDNSKFGVHSSYGNNSPDDPFSYDHLKRIPGTIIFQAFKL